MNEYIVQIDQQFVDAIRPHWEWMTNNYSGFFIASVFTFVIHEVAYFGAYMPWYFGSVFLF